MPEPQIPAPQEPPKAPETPPVTPPATPPAAPPATPPAAPPAPTPSLHDAAIAAVEAWQANPTPELKAAAQDAVKKAKESQPPAKVAPEKYDLKLPEGSKLDAKHQEAVAAFAKAHGLSQEDAQALLERDNLAIKAQMEKYDADYKAFVDDLKKQAEADPEIGGPKLGESVEKATRVLKKFDPNGELTKVLDESGYGNHPAVIRLLTKIFSSMKEDELVVTPQPAAKPKTMEERWYPGMAQKT